MRSGTAALFLFFALSAFASHEHLGIVRFNGLPVPGAVATAIQGEKELVAVTAENGVYYFSDLEEGVWMFRIEMPGFRAMDREIVIKAERSELEWDLTMLPLSEMDAEPASTLSWTDAPELKIKDVLEPPDPADALDSESGMLPANAAGQTRESIPSIFANLTPEQLSERAADGFLVNLSVNNAADSPFARSAAFGNNRGGVGSLYNGSFNLILDNSALDARSFSLTGQELAKPDYNRSSISLNFGGPLVIPRLIRGEPYFYLGYQRVRDRNVAVRTSRMPTFDERNGDLSGIRNPLGEAIPIFDPETGLPFDSNQIPRSRISPQAQSLLSLYPLPNSEGRGEFNYQIPIVDNIHQDMVQGRLSWNRISVGFNYQTIRTDNPNVFSFLDTSRASSIGLGFRFFQTFGRTVSMNLSYRFERSTDRTIPHFANRSNISGDMGIQGNNQEPDNWGPPNLRFSNYETLTEVQNSYDRNQANTVAAEVAIRRNEHYYRIGMEFNPRKLNLLSQQDARGTFTFTGAAAGYDFANFLLGIPDTSSIAFGNADKYFRTSNYALYLNDDWRVNEKFSLNLGIRWEYEAPVTELYSRLANLDIAAGFGAAEPVLASDPWGSLTGRLYPDSLVEPDKRGIQPRIGFAWRPLAASSLVVRGGYGIYRNTSVYVPLALQMAQQPPLSKNLSIDNSPENPLTIANGFDIPPEDIINTFAMDPDFRVSYAQNWQLSIQRDLPFSMQIIILYRGSRGSRLRQQFLPNTFPEGAGDACKTCPSGFLYTSSKGSSIRHAGEIHLRRRLGNGFTATLRYTVSRAIDDASPDGFTVAQNWLDFGAERALSDYDQRHQLNIQAQYTSGSGIFGPSLLSGWRGALLKEWTLGGEMTIGTGLPLTPVYLTSVQGTGVSGTVRPSLTGAPVGDAPAGLHINPAAYMPPASGEWGDAGRNSITGPYQFSLNAFLGRAFRYRDRYNIEFRLESTNVLNHVTFPSWNVTINSSQFGLPDRANPMRKLQIHIRVSF